MILTNHENPKVINKPKLVLLIEIMECNLGFSEKKLVDGFFSEFSLISANEEIFVVAEKLVA